MELRVWVAQRESGIAEEGEEVSVKGAIQPKQRLRGLRFPRPAERVRHNLELRGPPDTRSADAPT